MPTEVEISATSAAQKLLALKDSHVWLSRIEDDYVFRLEIGNPSLLIRKELLTAKFADGDTHRRLVRPVGQWRLFVGMGSWKLSIGGSTLHREDFQKREIATSYESQLLAALNGQRISRILWDRNLVEWQFIFDLGGQLSIKSNLSSPGESLGEQWTLFSTRGGRISCLGGEHLILKETF